MKEHILKLAEEASPKLVEIRRDLHEHPELGFEEVRTAEIVAGILESLGIEVQRGVSKTGVVGLIRGKHPGKTLLLRADMDALPVGEENEVAYCSKEAGKMHACGHDAHTTWLLGTAMILAQIREELHGTVKLVFQPSEEAPGGCDSMVSAGILKNPHVDMALAGHVAPSYKTGTYWIQKGPVTANPDFFTLKLYGNGAHGSEPHHSVDAINMGVKVYELLQTFVSRISNPNDEVVLSVCVFRSGTSQGAIPGDCEIGGTVRSFKPEIQQQAKAFIEQCAKAVTELYGGRYEFNYRINCFPVQNDPDLTERVWENTEELFGKQTVVRQAEKNMGGEDFCFISREVPSVFIHAGSWDGTPATAYPLHNPRFDLDETVLEKMAALFAYNAWKLLEK